MPKPIPKQASQAEEGSPFTDVLIIGAGSAGLTLAYELLKRGIEPQIIDEADEVGSSWRRRHDQLRLNTYRSYSYLPGAPFPKEYGAYVARDDFVTYLETYAQNLNVAIRFGIKARTISRNNDESWQVSTNQGIINARHVVVATGPERQPFIPTWPGQETFQGKIIHSAHFRHAHDYIGKRLLIVGASNSGVDIGNHLSEVELGTSWVSIRTPPTIAPQYALGLSSHAILMLIRWLPTKALDFMVALLGRIFLGDLRKVGLPTPPVGAVTRDEEDGVTLGIDNGFVKALKAGRFTVVPEIKSFDETSVHLVNGRSIIPEVVICATGYRPGLESLVGHLGVLTERGKPHFVADQSSPDHPGLWFFGLNTSIFGYLFTRKQEAKQLADNISHLL